MLKPDVTILVNTSDSFEDCWNPFFFLFKKYWPKCNYPILLNTEFKEYVFADLNIKTSKANAPYPERRLTWSECLIEALKQIETPLVLYLQEDYFIEQPVGVEVIKKFALHLKENPNVKYIGLTHFGNYPPFTPYADDNNLWSVAKNSRYRVSTQAGIWDRNTLLSYLRPDENGWMFEIFGTQRSKKCKGLFLTANREIFHPDKGTAIINYVHTGIIKGQWHEAIPTLFKLNGIEMDFKKRGFYRAKPYLIRKAETGRKLLKNPIKFYKKMMGK